MLDALRQLLLRHLAWRADGPALVFLVPVLVVAGVAAVFAPPYLRHPRYRDESRVRFWLFYALFVAGMAGTTLAADLVLFIACWEVMTLASYVLVAYETREPEALRASYKYFVMTQAATACLLFGVILLGVAGGSFAFDRIHMTFLELAATRPLLLNGILALMFLGFATKAGLYPFGDWLPDAHPAAPAPVSAVLSGVMIKLGIYGLLRVFVLALATLPGVAPAWGWLIGGFGLLSALVGGFAASAASDAKVLLAYSSIAQSGLIATGLGASLVLAPVAPPLAALALLGAVFHATGDSVVKSLLFLNAGAVQWRTGSRRFEALGGLFRGMPVTGGAALVASLAIAGFPPFVGFTGKWLMLQATALSGIPVVSLAGLALLVASLMSVLYATKFFAATFANRPMRDGNLEVPGPMRAAQLVLVSLIALISLAPVPLLHALVWALRDAPALAGVTARWAVAGAVGPATGAFAPLPLLLVGAWACVIAGLAMGREAEPSARRVWTGGVRADRGDPRVHPNGFYSPIREGLRRAYPQPRLPKFAAPRWILPAMDLDRWFYRPAGSAGRRVTEGLRRVHTGVPHLYLVWQLAGAGALVLLLIALLRR